MSKITLKVNGATHALDLDPTTPLQDYSPCPFCDAENAAEVSEDDIHRAARG